ncbi:MAG: cation:proton antiporter [Desulfobacterales bacterium]|nr:cation:proton antiporter [Desulfobacterales bacterium]MDD4392973.1 cation:proton antiporter [Desulfobacterales bacterium]
MNPFYPKQVGRIILILGILFFFAFWFSRCHPDSSWQRAGLINFFIGFVLLSAFVIARLLQSFRLPLISGYIFAGILAGPYVTGFLSVEMVQGLKLVDDLALSFIALTAGGALKISFIRRRTKAIGLNILLQSIIVFVVVFVFVRMTGGYFTLIRQLMGPELMVLAILLAVVSVARSPSSAIAVISECRATGPFTDMVLGVTVAIDVLIIIQFTLALTVSKMMLSGTGIGQYQLIMALCGEIAVSVIIGIALGKATAEYIRWAGHDLPLFLLFMAFGVTKTSVWIGTFMSAAFDIHLNLEPLLICMSAGFTVQNFSPSGSTFMASLEKVALPIYVMFFSLAGASLNLEALLICWPFAVSLALVRMVGIFWGTWFAGMINNDPRVHNRNAWMAFMTQAGVAIGLAQLAQRQFPEIGGYLSTVVLAVIAINQIIGPITLKLALNRVGEAADS